MAEQTDFLVIGSGVAGLFFALKAAALGKVTVIAKGQLRQTATAMAQGGIAAVTASEDSFENHIRDTLTAGAGLCHEDIVRMCVEQAPARVRDLLDFGVAFHSSLHREGGHSHKRILHALDQSGKVIEEALLQACKKQPNIALIEHQLAMDLLMSDDSRRQCLGAFVYDLTSHTKHTYRAHATVLATGGAGRVYKYTSNWDGATGDGIAMAFRAGAPVANMEFLQFHPTCLYHPKARHFLITEAMRGEGAELMTKDGDRFMNRYHPLRSLAPRDIVSRAIDAEMKRTGADCVYLDTSMIGAEQVRNHFPTIYRQCLEFGIDVSREPIPVVPAAHYLCGGIVTDQDGRTCVPGLFALGETAATGLHGANRLASNSLLEATVFAHNAAQWLASAPSLPDRDARDNAKSELAQPADQGSIERLFPLWDEVRDLMWRDVGISRSNESLKRAHERLHEIDGEVSELYQRLPPHKNVLELRNLVLVARLMVQSAQSRHESRGIHQNTDCPSARDEFLHDTVINPQQKF